ncbi:MAG: SGNH/GDSL hydrolase family protein [Muribaculaceae bacterium]|nr:SGNH/GDSL hydrolase family protein [Muribaculaceae bacterium]
MKDPIYRLWAILALAFAIFFVASAYDNINILGLELKPSGMYNSVVNNDIAQEEESIVGQPAMNPQLMVESKETIPAITFPQPTDTASKSILFIGDSMLEGLYPRLAAYAKQNGHKLNTVIWYSSTSQVWGECDTLSHFIKQFSPDYIFVCLGANELFIKDIKKKRAKYVDHILNEIGDRHFLWIGPPNWKEDTGINDLLESKLPKGSFFLSNGMKFDRAKDGAHPTRSSAALWMDSVARWMPGNALYPIKLDKPTQKSANANRVVVLQPKK